MTNKEDKELEERLFNFFKENTDVPNYIDKAVDDAISRGKKRKQAQYKLRRIAVIIFCLAIVTTGGVFAKEIISFITSIFTNSTPGIDSAVENGYVQNVDMDFVYDNNIGIKINNIVMDDTTLDISFLYDCSEYKNINKINLLEYEIKDDKNNLIMKVYKNSNDVYEIDKNSIIKGHVDMMNNNEFDSYYSNSILFKCDSIEAKKLYFNIDSIYIENGYGKKQKSINGSWNFEIDIKEDFINNEKNVENIITNSKYIENISKVLNETTLSFDIDFNEEIDKNVIYNIDNIILKDNEHIYEVDNFLIDNKNLHIEFNYGKYDLNQELNLYIKFSEDKEVNLMIK